MNEKWLGWSRQIHKNKLKIVFFGLKKEKHVESLYCLINIHAGC